MASFTRGLGLVLAICMAATRPSSAIRVGSSDTSRWWETKDFTDLVNAAKARRAAGDFAGLESVYTKGYRRAVALRNEPAQIVYLSNLGSARWVSLRFAQALEAYLKASDLAERTGDWTAVGGIAVNLAHIYERMGDASAALSVLERGKAALERQPVPPPFKAQLLMRLRSVREALQENPTEPRYLDAVDAARESGNLEAEAAAWDLLGAEKTKAGTFDEAEAALGQALRLRVSNLPKDLPFSYAALGALRLAQAERAAGEARRLQAREAESFTDRAMTVRGAAGPARYVLLHQRGRIREVLGQSVRALQDFRQAMDGTNEWNKAVPAALSLVTAANTTIQREMFDSFIESAARQALRTGERDWAAESFLAVEANRAASLRQSRELAPVWRQKLPAAYWETLARLDEADAGLEAKSNSESARLRLELTEMESNAGIGFSVKSVENFRTRNSLIHFQQGLGESDLFLSFYLGARESYLWAVTRNSLEIHRLREESEIRDGVRRFREAVISGEPAGDRLGADLYQRLFGSLSPEDTAKTSWLLSLDKELFDLPFAALVTGYRNGRPVYAAEGHSSASIPSTMFATQGMPAVGKFLGVADPVYNSADPRQAHKSTRKDSLSQLNRLVNSGRELRRSAEVWQTGARASLPVRILEGTSAERNIFLHELDSTPAIIHLATHVLAPSDSSPQAFLAFSLDARGQPGLLSTLDIGMLHVPGALVVMTGCATGTGDARAGTGLLGLSRAWLMAGARTVVATSWPVPDADGDLIPAFYGYLPDHPAAEALRRSQVEMIHSGTWQASPSFWAAFQVTEGGR